MEEIFFSVIDSTQQIPKQLYNKYPVTIDVGRRKGDGKLRVEQLQDKHTIELVQAEARELFTYEPKTGYEVIFPDALSVGIRRYDWRHLKHSKDQVGSGGQGLIASESAFEELMRSSSSNAKLKTDFEGEQIHHELSYCDIYMDATMAETLEISAHNNEDINCFHGEDVILYNHLLTEAICVGSGTCYDLENHIQIKTVGEVGVYAQDHRDVLGRLHPRGEKRITRRFQDNETKTLNTSIMPADFDLKKKIFDGEIAVEVEKRELIQYDDEVIQLDRIAEKWIDDQNVDESDKIIMLLEEIGRKDKRIEPSNSDDMRKRFRQQLLVNLRKTDGEVRNIRNNQRQEKPKRMAAVLIITMCDVLKRAIWGNDRFELVRGTYTYAKCKMGSVYNAMWRDMAWQLRSAYKDQCPRVCDRRKYIMQRYNYFSLSKEIGDTIYKWDVKNIRDNEKTNREEGWLYKSIGDEDEGEGELIHDFDEAKYTEYMQRVIQGPWVEKDGIGILMKEEGAIEQFDFTQDAYIDEAGFLRLPPYYNKLIKSSLYESSFKIRRIDIRQNKGQDPWIQKTEDEVKKENEMWLLPLRSVLDWALCLTGNILSTAKQEQSARFAAIVEALKKEKDVVRQKYSRNELYTCPTLNVLSYTGYRQRRFVFSILKNHLPKDILMSIYPEEDMEYDPHDYTECMGKEDVLMKMTSIFEVVLYLIQMGFERQILMPGEEEVRVIKQRMIERERRDEILEALAPNFSRIIKMSERPSETAKNENLLPMYFYQALVLSNEVIYEDVNRSHPMLMLCEKRIRIVPVRTNFWQKIVPLLSVLHILKYHAGWRTREEPIEEDIRTVWPYLVRYWLDLEFKQKEITDPTIIRKHPMNTHLSTYCVRMSEVYSFALPIVHPTKGVIAVGVIPQVISNAQGFSIIRERFSSIERYVHARIILRVSDDGHVQVYGEGNVKCSILEKFCCGRKTKIVRIKLNGKVYANPEIISKLMN
uniref:Outer capsid protein VP2 n=1 Tax=Epizootic hemorrhagic disease virus 7 TaxID=238102 RepID=A0A0C4UQW1_9REOV|nr:VP2 [Epizootic hemorrhagic disease virus 7]